MRSRLKVRIADEELGKGRRAGSRASAFTISYEDSDARKVTRWSTPWHLRDRPEPQDARIPRVRHQRLLAGRTHQDARGDSRRSKRRWKNTVGCTMGELPEQLAAT